MNPHALLLYSNDLKNSAVAPIIFRMKNTQEGRRRHCQVIYSQFGLAIHRNDHKARRRFVEWAQNEIAVVSDFHKRILFSDEAHFWLNGYVNKQNTRIWSEANPQVYVETPLHPEKLTVWCANWPPRSCDLTPLDYFLCGYVKSLVYADKPQTLDHLEDNIRRVIADIRPQMLEKVIENWTSRLDHIRASRGSPIPEIIFKIFARRSLGDDSCANSVKSVLAQISPVVFVVEAIMSKISAEEVIRTPGTSSANKRTITDEESQNSDLNAPSKKIRKYNEEFIKYGFTFCVVDDEERPICVTCNQKLANESMKPAKLKRHLETKHKELENKHANFFKDERKI
ncbi:uncharacterized protein TNCV_3445701 [Trichonephila clavipes]|nr:uncharacterized protein TNCV_3445701 [Trichonephila clavipes]